MPPAFVVYGLASSGPGDVASQPVLDLVVGRAPQNATLPNYDTDRNADPGLTILRSLQVLESTDPAQRQVWALPADVVEVPATATLSLGVAPAGVAAPGAEMHVRAGLYDCDATRTVCLRVVRDTLTVLATTGTFTSLTFDLSPGVVTPLAAGHRLELRFAAVFTSDVDVWIAYDSADHPSALTLGP